MLSQGIAANEKLFAIQIEAESPICRAEGSVTTKNFLPNFSLKAIVMNRPTSPHLTIYRPQITSVLSILHRMTGVALYAGALVLVGWLAIAAYYPSDYARLHDCLTSLVGRALLFGWTLAFYYHLANGIRHLFWDMGKGFKLGAVTASGVFVLIFTLAATLGSWAYAYHVVGKL